MKVQIIAVGQKMPKWVDLAFDEYSKRLPKQQKVLLTTIPIAPRNMNHSVQKLQQIEAQKIEQKLTSSNKLAGSLFIALDEHGKQWSTQDWSDQYRQWLNHHPQVNIVIGGPDGISPELLKKANQTIALGRMTLPHGLARVILMEQLYRAWTVIEGHPYHRE